MRKIAFVIPWAGKLPTYFSLWLKTCEENPTIDFLVITSEKLPENLSSNIHQIFMNFEEIRERVQKCFDFPISLQEPYKLCDFKPAYGEIFADELKEYDFWGHCDIDLIWGDIRKFITEDILEKYDRIYTHGHCCLYRNCARVNAWYRTLPHEGFRDWKEVFSNPKSFCFDEWHKGGLSEIVKANGEAYYDGVDMADLDISKGFFSPWRLEKFQTGNTYFEYCNGKLWICIPNGNKQEVLYCHFQKRKPEIHLKDTDQHFYFCAPNIITNDFKNVKRFRIREICFEWNYQCDRIKRKIKKIRTGGGVL